MKKYPLIRVLHIDDEISYLEIIQILIQKHQYSNIKVDFTTNPKEIERLLFAKPYDVIVCDYRMPEMNGLDVLRYLRKIGIDISFILLTGWDRSISIQKQLSVYPNVRYLQKSLDCVTMTNKLVLTINSLFYENNN